MVDASATPNEDSPNASSAARGISSATVRTLSFTPTNGASTSRIRPWIIACVVPPSALPIATAHRSMGATRTSLRNPNSRSHTIDIAPKIAVNRIAIPMMPGYTNWIYVKPPDAPNNESRPSAELNPEPKTTRNSSGCASEATSRQRSRQYRRRSRYQMM
ncbi:MAG: hypothetical protein AUJ02_00395 [Chloroflexi bacterium 13_1_40CM_3_65_12]|nr:MAG: hypothetical protein AUJ02_00395 [Chloroflexi bacterium 13_1_40CM_3_65_12]OLD48784.1 MAG: hypothetical protein AUI42_10840 [Actinobacteria bacterium 13_1_40CM_2_65_8]